MNPNDPYLSSMVTRFNTIYRWIFGPFFSLVRFDAAEVGQLKELSQKGTLVYVMKNRGQLEYSFFNHLFLQEGIPLARFANGSRTLFWRPFREWGQAFERSSAPDPIASGYLEKLVVEGESALLNLKVSHDLVFGSSTEAFKFIPSLLQAARKSSKPVYLITQQFLYDRRPEKEEKTFMDLLFGEKSNPGMIRKLILFFMFFRRHATVKFGEALDLKKFVEENSKQDLGELSSQLNALLLSRLKVERKSIMGPLMVPRETLLERMLADSTFRGELETIAVETGKSSKELESQAKHLFDEIAAKVNYSYVDFYDRMIGWLVNNVYDGLDVDLEGLAKIKAVVGRHPVVLVPPHKSHIDYLLLSYLFYENDLTLPHVCAGINLKFWPAGPLIRRAAGFFIRRSFKGDKLYKAVLDQYLKMLIKSGYSTEFFIEGTRSRTGKLLKPKMGILSSLMKVYFDGEVPDIYFVPLSINYERIMEEKSYIDEIGGGSKKKENMAGVVKASQHFRKKYGKVFIRFAEPISLKSFCDARGIEPRAGLIDQSRRDVEVFAYRLTYDINRVSVVTSSALMATALLTFEQKGIPQKEVVVRALALKRYLEFKGANLSDIVRQKENRVYWDGLTRLEHDRLITLHEDFSEKFYTIDDSRRPVLDYHKNNSIHFFVSLACFSKILAISQSTSLSLAVISKRYESLKTLLRHDFTFSERASLKEHLVRIINFYVGENLIRYDEVKEMVHFEACLGSPQFKVYAGLLNAFFESSLLTLLYLKHVPFVRLDRARLETAILEKGRVLHLKGDLKYAEALSQFNIRSALEVFRDLGWIKVEEGRLLTRIIDEEAVTQWEDLLQALLGNSAKKFLTENFVEELEAPENEKPIGPVH